MTFLYTWHRRTKTTKRNLGSFCPILQTLITITSLVSSHTLFLVPSYIDIKMKRSLFSISSGDWNLHCWPLPLGILFYVSNSSNLSQNDLGLLFFSKTHWYIQCPSSKQKELGQDAWLFTYIMSINCTIMLCRKGCLSVTFLRWENQDPERWCNFPKSIDSKWKILYLNSYILESYNTQLHVLYNQLHTENIKWSEIFVLLLLNLISITDYTNIYLELLILLLLSLFEGREREIVFSSSGILVLYQESQTWGQKAKKENIQMIWTEQA